jgi:hypothetical protein
MTSATALPHLGALEPRTRRLTPRRFLARLALVPLLIALPFAVLVRTATHLYSSTALPTWFALFGAAGLTLALLTLYGAWLAKKLTGRARLRTVALWLALPLVVAYCGHSLLYLSRVNAKTERVRAFYGDVHPLLRLGVSTLVLLDGDAVITDFGREPADYVSMGLPAAEASLHYRQADGWVHAMDLRTLGRSEVRNRLVEAYFRLLGFRTLRHVGTADHLHVSLPLRSGGR